MFKRGSARSGLLAQLLPVLAFVACTSVSDPLVTSELSANTSTSVNNGLAVIAGSAVTPVPTVLLKSGGKGLANVTVRWTVTGGGKVGLDSSKTDAGGATTPGSWTLGPAVGVQTLTATVVGNEARTIVFTATAGAGPVAALNLVSTAPTGVVNADVTPPPSIRAVDQFGNPVANLPVTFVVTSGGGSLTGAQQITNASGVATLGAWKLGTVAGTQSARADAGALSVSINATALGAAAADLVAVSGASITGSTGKRVCNSPSVIVRDAYGNGVAQVKVVFTPGAASGGVDRDTVTTDNAGTATVGAWTLGGAATQTITATTAALPGKQIAFTVTLVPAPGYGICARFIGTGGTDRQRLAVTRAVAKWQSVIVGHVASTRISTAGTRCFINQPEINETVEDLLLYIELAEIDGARGIIGQASPCFVHAPSFLTLMGYLQLDVADLDLTLSTGTLDNVVLHEIGHIIGIGTLWGQITSSYSRNLLFGAGGAEPYFAGAAARAQFAQALPGFATTPVPVENCLDAANVPIPNCTFGTRDAHWRKAVFNTELMQGYVAPNMPMSKVTVASLADLGYLVNLDAADPFSFTSALRASDAADQPALLMMNDIADTPIWSIDRLGNRTLLRTPVNPLKRFELR